MNRLLPLSCVFILAAAAPAAAHTAEPSVTVSLKGKTTEMVTADVRAAAIRVCREILQRSIADFHMRPACVSDSFSRAMTAVREVRPIASAASPIYEQVATAERAQ